MEDNFGEVEEGDTGSLQVSVDDVIYNLWGMKEPNYVISMMDTGIRLLVVGICKDTMRRWNENG